MNAAAMSRPAERVFFSVAAALFMVSLAITIAWCMAMAPMGEMRMPGGWTMSMAWMPMGEQSWLDAALTFVGMWTAMMVAMMLPSLVPMLWRYREVVEADDERLGVLTVVVGASYFSVWTLFGIAVFPLGAAFASLTMHAPEISRVVPLGAGVIVLIAGLTQFTPWKQRHLACCRDIPEERLRGDVLTAWRHGLRMGVHCSACCAGLTAMLFVIGVMDLYAMAVVTAAITIERLSRDGVRAAQAVGVVVVSFAIVLIARAAGAW